MKEHKIINIMSDLLKFILIVFIVYSIKIFIDKPDDYMEKENNKTNSDLYEDWKKCIDDSDGSDISCMECDSLYNYNEDFIY